MKARIVIIDLGGLAAFKPCTGPLAIVGGLPVLVRTLLVLQRAGMASLILVTEPEKRDEVERTIAGEPRITIPLTLVSNGSSVLQCAAAAVADGAKSVAIWPGALTFGRLAPSALKSTVTKGGALVAASPEGAVLTILDAEAVLRIGHASLDAGLASLDAAGRIEHVELDIEAHPITTSADIAEAERRLLFSLRKSGDGFVANFNRYISLAISRRLLNLPISPNVVTFLGGLLGIACGVVASHGGYLWMLAGALGFQLNSILDGIDGEIARAKLLESWFGQWLDTLADDLSNFAFTVGASIGCWRMYGSEVYLTLAVTTAIGIIFTAIFMYHYGITVAKSGDINNFKPPWEEENAEKGTPGRLEKTLGKLRFLLRRDTFTGATVVCALFGVMRFMVWGYAIGATSIWASVLGYHALRPVLKRVRPPFRE